MSLVWHYKALLEKWCDNGGHKFYSFFFHLKKKQLLTHVNVVVEGVHRIVRKDVEDLGGDFST